MIACNKGCLPQIDSSDTAFLNRMIAVPMRAKFNNGEAASGVPHSFPMDMHVQEKLAEARMAVMHVFIAAHRRYVDGGEQFGDLPAGCLELRSAVVNDSDPRLEAINLFLDQDVSFGVVRKPAQRGRKVLGFILRDDLIARLRNSGTHFRDIKSSVMKTLVTSVMTSKGVSLTPKTSLEGSSVYNVFTGCEWRVNP